jgi:hypothetical protein
MFRIAAVNLLQRMCRNVLALSGATQCFVRWVLHFLAALPDYEITSLSLRLRASVCFIRVVFHLLLVFLAKLLVSWLIIFQRSVSNTAKCMRVFIVDTHFDCFALCCCCMRKATLLLVVVLVLLQCRAKSTLLILICILFLLVSQCFFEWVGLVGLIMIAHLH